ncbi:phage protein F-like protein [Enterococcus faecalis 06-MB-DW-09]|nr:phage protein F-like protein [Enterococcus faecalis 06-MB-DW-09]
MTYWKKREQDWIQQQIESEAAISRQIARRYQQTLDQIEKEIKANWDNFVGKNGITITEAKKAVSEMDVKAYQRKAKRYVREKNFSRTANREMKLHNLTMRVNRLELVKSQIGLELIAMSDDMNRYTADILTKAGLAEARRRAGIMNENVFPGYTKFVRQLAGASFHGATFSQRIWGNMAALKVELDRLLTMSIIQGKYPNALARQLRDLFNAKRYEAERLMRTETARIQLGVQLESYKQSGIEHFIYIAEPSACSVCAGLADKVFAVADFEIGVNAPPMHPTCRCSTAPYVKKAENQQEIEYNKVDKALKELLQKMGDDWFNSLSDGEKDTIKAYTGPYFESMNGLLRDPNHQGLGNTADMYTHINSLTRSLSKFKLDHDILTYRGVSQAEYDAILKGNVFPDFKSTSVTRKVARDFNDHLVTFRIPKGTSGSYVGNNSQVFGEDEFTLNRGSKYTVVKTEHGLEVSIIGREEKKVP